MVYNHKEKKIIMYAESSCCAGTLMKFSFFFFFSGFICANSVQIQELDYTITVALRSDARSAVEGLRWILVRRAAIAIVISAVMILATLRYSSYMSRTQEIERQKMRASQHNNNNSYNSNNNSDNIDSADYEANHNSLSADRHLPNDVRHQSGDEEILVRAQEGSGPGYVSLG